MTQRVYLPLNAAELAELVAERRLGGPRPAYAVTEGLRTAWPEGDDDGWEYVAMMAAGEAAWHRRQEGEAPRRIVVAADVGSTAPAAGEHPAELVVPHDVVWRNVASAHVDTADVTAAQVEGGEAPDLAWFATQEIPSLA